MITDCGLLGNGANLSMTTLRGGGGIRLPEIVITFLRKKKRSNTLNYFNNFILIYVDLPSNWCWWLWWSFTYNLK